MALLRGSASITRLNATSVPEMPDFDQHPFEPIPAGSEVRERIGFVPFRPEAPYQVGDRRFAFRVRVDRRRPDATRVRERVQQLVQTEMETTGAPFVGPKKRKELRHLAEEELITETSPQSKIVEGVVEDRLLYVGTTAKSWLGTVLLQLRKVGVLAEPKTPWGDLGDEEVYSDLVETSDASQSVLGCRFLKTVFEDRELMFEPESGSVRLQTREAKVSLTGAVLPELHRYLQREKEVEILAAKLLAPEARFRLDALTWRLSGLSAETAGKGHWTEVLDERLEKISGVYELLDRKYAAWRRGSPGGS